MHDLLADLPAPRDDEPSSLRQDILDELSDHLSCAFHRELVKSGNEQTAKARVLDRFGDPRRIACQLWFQAMWSRIMLQRVSLGLQGLLTVGVLAVAFLMFRVLDFQSRMHDEWQTLRNQSASNQQMLTLLLQRLPQPAATTTEGAGGMGSAAGFDEGMSGAGFMAPPLPQSGDMSSGMSSAPLPSGDPSAMMMGSDAAGAMSGMSSAPATRPNLVIRVSTDGGFDVGQPAVGYFLEVQDENGQGVPGEPVSGYPGAGMFGGGMSGSGGFSGSSFGAPSGGSTFTGDGRFIRMWTDQPRSNGVQYTNIQPGRYTATVEFPDGRVGKQRFAVLPKQTKTVTVVCPPPAEPSLVTIVGPKLEQIDPAIEIRAGISISQPPFKLNGTEWSVKDEPLPCDVRFDPATGIVNLIHNPRKRLHFDETDPPDTRFVSLKSGTYQFLWTFTLHNKNTSNEYPLLEGETGAPVSMSVQPGTTTWTLSLPESLHAKLQQFWTEMPDRMQKKSSAALRSPRQTEFVETSAAETGIPGGQIQFRPQESMGMIAINPDKYGSAALGVGTPGGRINLTLGTTHELLLLQVPGIASPLVVWTKMEFPKLTAEAVEYLSKNAVPIQLTTDDIQTIVAGNSLTKVMLLAHNNEAASIETVVSSRLDPDKNPIEEAEKRGSVLAIWRLDSPTKLPSRTADDPAKPNE